MASWWSEMQRRTDAYDDGRCTAATLTVKETAKLKSMQADLQGQIDWLERKLENEFHVLFPRHIKAGLYIEEDDHNVSIMRDGKALAVFSTRVSIWTLRAAADKAMAEVG